VGSTDERFDDQTKDVGKIMYKLARTKDGESLSDKDFDDSD
jgi:hypothetical protein